MPFDGEKLDSGVIRDSRETRPFVQGPLSLISYARLQSGRLPDPTQVRSTSACALKEKAHRGGESYGQGVRVGVMHVVTSDLAVVLMRGQSRFLQNNGFDVTVISSPGKWLDEAAQTEGIRTIPVPMERGFAPLRDLVSLWRLWRNMQALCPVITNVSTPKAGLLAGFAAWLSRVPCRFYTLRGLRFETAKGLRRHLLIWTDALSCFFAHRVICVSESLRQKAIASGLTPCDKTVVFGVGSSNGIDVSRFTPTAERLRRAAELRSKLGIPSSAAVVGFVGRLTRDKGIAELVEAFARLGRDFTEARLLVVGKFEDNDELPIETQQRLKLHPHIILTGMVDDTAPYYALMDVLALPSHREGLPNVVLEALAAGKPVVAARATGIVDVLTDGKTGLLFTVGDIGALVEKLKRILADKKLAAQLAEAGKQKIKSDFRQDIIWEALQEEYLNLLQKRQPRSLSACRGSFGAETP